MTNTLERLSVTVSSDLERTGKSSVILSREEAKGLLKLLETKNLRVEMTMLKDGLVLLEVRNEG